MDLTNQFLIAMPALRDPNFHRTVTYLCAHNNEGAMGIVINRPLDLNLGEVLDHMSIEVENQDVNNMMVLQGGPVQRDRGFVIHEHAGEWDAVLAVGSEIGVATSRDILMAVAHGEGRAEFTDAATQAACDASGTVALRFLDNDLSVAARYPANPNGSPAGIAGLSSLDGRATIMMPHPERVFRTVQHSWAPDEWGEDGGWMRLFRNARQWLA